MHAYWQRRVLLIITAAHCWIHSGSFKLAQAVAEVQDMARRHRDAPSTWSCANYHHDVPPPPPTVDIKKDIFNALIEVIYQITSSSVLVPTFGQYNSCDTVTFA